MNNENYIIKIKFITSFIFVGLWILFCCFIQYSWFKSLQDVFGTLIAMLIIIGLSFLPAVMIIFLLSGVIFDNPKRYKIRYDLLENITILIAAYNEEESIYNTLKSIAKQEYPKKIIVKVIDNNSKDKTKYEIFRAINDFSRNNKITIEYLFEKTKGKFSALNYGLETVTTRYVITIDADTFLYRNALIDLVNNMYIRNQTQKVVAIAGTVMVKNSNVNILTKIQDWEYFLSITSIKRMQGLFGSVLVAQGAFSIYDTKLLKDLGGWKDSIGEDIVLTWELLSKGYKTYYADCAVSFTNVPTKFKIYARQRARWARGMIEGFRHFSFKECSNGYAKWFIFSDLFLFVIDFSIVFIYIPGLVAALLFQNFLIVGFITLLLLPITVLVFSVMFISEYKRVYKMLNIKCSKNYLSFIVFMLFYSIIMSPICVWGYLQEFIGAKRKWK